MFRLVLLVAWFAIAHFAAFPAKTPSTGLHVPEGFVVERVAAEPDVVYPMFAAFDDRGRLFVAESSGLDLYAELKAQTRKCRIRLLEDPDERGRFRKSSIFADKLVFPMGLVWRDGKLFVADPPDLITLEDTDGDGKADKRTVLLTGFGHVDNGSLHGLTFGPDGLLYMTLGQPDGYKIKRRDGVIVHGKTGALLRCRPDGSDPEVLCRGFENLVEVVFSLRGDIIGTNNWYQRPSGGIRDCLVHLVDGGLYPRHADIGSPQPITGEPLPAMALYPAVALSGLEIYRGQAFAGMQGNLFSAQHNARKVQRHVVVPQGSTFRAQDFDFLTNDSPDFHPSDVLEDADGSLLVLDTGSWYVHHCPTGQIRKVQATGGIYRVSKAGAAQVNDPRGLRLNWANASVVEFALRLGDPRPAVQDRARQKLAASGESAIRTLAALVKHKDTIVRQHAIWALSAIPGEAASAPLLRAVAAAEADIVIPAARALGLRRDKKAARSLDALLLREPAIRLAAAEALARAGDAESIAQLWKALDQPEVDRFLEHAIVHALFHLADTAALEAALDKGSPRVQKAALILLDQPPRPKDQLHPDRVVHRLRSPDRELRQAAVLVLRKHPEWADHAQSLLKGWLAEAKLSDEDQRSFHDLILAFQNHKPTQDLLGQAIADSSTGRRIAVIEALAETSLVKLPDTWVTGLQSALKPGNPVLVRLQAARTAAVLQAPSLDATLERLAESSEETTALRLEALRGIVLRKPKLSPPAFNLVLNTLKDEDDPIGRLTAGEICGRAQLADSQIRELVGVLRKDVLVSPSVVFPALLRAESGNTTVNILRYLDDAVRKGWRPSPQELKSLAETFKGFFFRSWIDELADLSQKMIDGQKERLATFEPQLKGGDPLKGREVFFSKKATCSSCHRIGSDGGTVGPDLTKVGAVRTGRDLLEAILVPSSTFAQGFEPYVFITAEGKVLNGVIARQSANMLVVREASGSELQLAKDKLQEMRRSPISLMPDGLERNLSETEFRDLLAYLQGLK